MDRKIKFKAQNIDHRWFYGYLVYKKVPFSTPCTKICYTYDDVYYSEVWVYEETVCQYTGKKDADGKEIYEHDLLMSVQTKAMFELKWNEDYCCYSLYDIKTGNCAAKNFMDHKLTDLKVIANSFDKDKNIEV